MSGISNGGRKLIGGESVRRLAGVVGGEMAVSARVLGEVVAAHETLVASPTRELLLARVRPHVSLQLVGTHEPATQPLIYS